MADILTNVLVLLSIISYYVLITVIDKSLIFSDVFIEDIRRIFFSKFFDSFFFFLHTKFFVLFLLCFPLIVACFYLIIFIFSKNSLITIKDFMYSKELIVFFGFFYFFLFVLVLEDFIFYTETYRLYFLFPMEETYNSVITYKN